MTMMESSASEAARAAASPRSVQNLGLVQVFARIYTVVTLFVGILLELAWMSFWMRNRPDSPETRATWDAVYHHQAIRFRKVAERLGGLVIKVGQFLSSRVDILPKAFIDELQSLQDQVSAAPWAEIHPILEANLGPLARHFATFPTVPIAAASLGQVYEATLRSGRRVAVKVQRPRIDAIVRADLKAMTIVVNLATRLTRFGQTFDLFTVLREFRRTVFEELDYLREQKNTEAIRAAVAGIPFVHVPDVLPELSTRHVLTMEYRDGTKVNQRDALVAQGVNPSLVAERLIHLYLHLIMESGVFHADPHPGNILVAPDGDLVLLDYGMVGRIDPATRRQIRRLFVAVSERNPSELVESLRALGMVRPSANQLQLTRHVRYLLERYYAETLTQLAGLDVPALLRDFEALLRDEPIQVPGEFAFLGRTVAILVGLATALDPDINLVRLFAPYAERFVTEDHGGATGYALTRAQKWGSAVLEWPTLSSRVLRQIESGEVEAKISWDEGSLLIRTLTRSVRSLSQSIYVIGFTIAGSLLLNTHPFYAQIAFALAALTILAAFLRRHRP